MEEGKSCRSSNGNVIFIIGVVGVVIFFVIVVNIDVVVDTAFSRRSQKISFD